MSDSTLEKNIEAILNDVEWRYSKRKISQTEAKAALLSLYQKELEQAMDERDKHCAKHGHIILRGEAAKRYLGLTGEQP